MGRDDQDDRSGPADGPRALRSPRAPRTRNLVFGEAAELYHEHRPRYPDALIDAVLAAAPGVDHALEIGAGTGIASQQIAARGVAVTAIEPDPAMAAVNRRESAGLPVQVVEARLEDWEGAIDAFGLAFSAQAWHWIDPAVGAAQVARALAPDGVLAVWWNLPAPSDDPIDQRLRSDLDVVYRAHAPTLLDDISGIGHWSEAPEPMGASGAPYGFAAVAWDSFPWVARYDTASYLDLLQTQSDHRLLPPEQLDALLEAVADAIDRRGGELRRPYRADLVIARPAP